MTERLELAHPDFVTIDTIGLPGQRTFYLQATQGDVLVTVLIEKEHAAAFAVTAHAMLDEIGRPPMEPSADSMGLIQPVEALFRARQISLGYDQVRDRLVIVAEGFPSKEELPFEVRIWITREQTAALARQSASAVEAGRPTCPLCNEVILPGEPHICVRGNGRKHAQV
ncbi:MAG: DUF3090 family protein [Chloroflexi bacterium]|nr:DUF3090 family protein [Chloroflexota bacterium]